MKRYQLNRSALADLREINSYLASAPQVIQLRIMGQIEGGFHQAADFPEVGFLEKPLSTRFGEPVRSLLVYPYRIYYLPEQSPITNFAIVHGKRDPLAVLKAR